MMPIPSWKFLAKANYQKDLRLYASYCLFFSNQNHNGITKFISLSWQFNLSWLLVNLLPLSLVEFSPISGEQKQETTSFPGPQTGV